MDVLYRIYHPDYSRFKWAKILKDGKPQKAATMLSRIITKRAMIDIRLLIYLFPEPKGYQMPKRRITDMRTGRCRPYHRDRDIRSATILRHRFPT